MQLVVDQVCCKEPGPQTHFIHTVLLEQAPGVGQVIDPDGPVCLRIADRSLHAKRQHLVGMGYRVAPLIPYRHAGQLQVKFTAIGVFLRTDLDTKLAGTVRRRHVLEYRGDTTVRYA